MKHPFNREDESDGDDEDVEDEEDGSDCDDSSEFSGDSFPSQVALFNNSIQSTLPYGTSSVFGGKGENLCAPHVLYARLPNPLQKFTLEDVNISPWRWMQRCNILRMHRANPLLKADKIRNLKTLAWLFATELESRQTMFLIRNLQLVDWRRLAKLFQLSYLGRTYWSAPNKKVIWRGHSILESIAAPFAMMSKSDMQNYGNFLDYLFDVVPTQEGPVEQLFQYVCFTFAGKHKLQNEKS